MVRKSNDHSKSRVPKITHYSSEILSKLTKIDTLANGFSIELKKRLSNYQSSLVRSNGFSDGFDDKIEEILAEYVWDKPKYKAVRDYLDNYCLDDDGYKFSRNLRLYSKTEDAMLRFADSNHTNFGWNENYQKSLEEMKGIFRQFHLTPVSFYNDDDIRRHLPKENTHSGYYYIESGKKYKGDNMEGIYTRFREAQTHARECGSFNRPILIGFRTQASGEFEDDGSFTGHCKHKTRVVSMFDLLSVINELQFSYPIQQAISKQEFYAGGKNDGQIANIIHNWQNRYRYFMSVDYSSFDQTISDWLIRDAFEVLKCGFTNFSDENNVDYQIMVHDFIHKSFILNEGVLVSNKGVPSGSMFTQIIDTIVNVLVVKTFLNSKGLDGKMIAMGDDNAIFVNQPNLMDDLASYISKNFGLIIKIDDKSNCGDCRTDDIKFLSKFWKLSGCYRHPNSLISRMLYPERYRKYGRREVLVQGIDGSTAMRDIEVTPAQVINSYILMYPAGMLELMDVNSFRRRHPELLKESSYRIVDNRYISGSLAYSANYIKTVNHRS